MIYEVRCREVDGRDPNLVVRVGGHTFSHKAADAIEAIETNTDRYFVLVRGNTIWLQVGFEPGTKSKYLTTSADEGLPQTLLDLPKCP